MHHAAPSDGPAKAASFRAGIDASDASTSPSGTVKKYGKTEAVHGMINAPAIAPAPIPARAASDCFSNESSSSAAVLATANALNSLGCSRECITSAPAPTTRAPVTVPRTSSLSTTSGASKPSLDHVCSMVFISVPRVLETEVAQLLPLELALIVALVLGAR